MKLITKDVDYAVRAIAYIIKGQNDKVTVSELADNLQISRSFLRKILQVLSKNKILVSVKGNRGGFSLRQESNNIFLIDIIKIFQGNLNFTNCILRDKICLNNKICGLRKKIINVERIVEKELKGVTMAELMK